MHESMTAQLQPVNDNPLLQTDGLPAFGHIKPEHVVPAVDYQLAHNRATISELLQTGAPPSWATLQAIEDLDDTLNRVWSPISHLHSVADNEELRIVYNECLPKLSDYATEMGQNRALYEAYRTVAESEEFERLEPAQHKLIDNALRDFRLSGIDLEGDAKQRYRTIQQELSKLQTRFEENLLDATHAWRKHITDPEALRGLPDSALALAWQNAQREGLEGWLLTLDAPCYIPVMSYADNRELRREIYEAYVTRASDRGPDQGKYDNSSAMEHILALRHEMAQLLGFETYAHYSLARKMAKSPQEVLDFLTDLAERSRPVAQAEYDELCSFAADQYGETNIEAWDVPYYGEKFRQARFNISQEDLRPYFPAPAVIEGLFTIVKRLYGVDIRQCEPPSVWHPDVSFYEILDDHGARRGAFYLDPYARPRKRGGAWMDECIVRKRTRTGIDNPVAYLVCNFAPPMDDKPSLLTHHEVLTLFHEFGHGLHHLLTCIDYSAVSGINGVPWDAVELPSQFMENWCWEREALDLFARHHESGAPIDEDLFNRMQAAKTFQSGMQMVRQLEFALFDFRLHLEYAGHDTGSIQTLLEDVRRQVAVVRAPDFNRFQHSFSHIFAGGYGAGYYSYKWAEVLSADAFSLFEERGLFDPETGRAFLQTILEQGGSRDPLDLFIEFRGRPPSIEPLLRHSGIAA